MYVIKMTGFLLFLYKFWLNIIHAISHHGSTVQLQATFIYMHFTELKFVSAVEGGWDPSA